MKTDDDSGEVDEPPSSANRAKICIHAENDELQWARRHVPRDPAQCPEPQPDNASPGPAPSPGARATFRKTELRDRPPLFRSEEPVLRQKTLLNLQGPDAEVPYGPLEDALRNLAASIVRRQETIARRLAGQVDELHDRLDVLEDRIEMAIDHIDRRISSLEKERDS